MSAAEAREQLGRIIRVKLAEAHEHGRGAGRNGADAASPPAHVSLAALGDILAAADFYAGSAHAELMSGELRLESPGPDCGCGLGAARCRDLEDGA